MKSLIARLAPGALVVLMATGFTGCAFTTEDGAFDLQAERTGASDRKGFPVLVGPQYNRDEPLKRTTERARLEAELQALAEARKTPGIDVDLRRDEILQKRLIEIARNHGENAAAEIEAECVTLDDGQVKCGSD